MLEQDIACGVDGQGTDIKASSLSTALIRFLSEKEQVLSSESKLRLLMLYLACVGNVSTQVRQKLIDSANLKAEDQQVLLSMMQTGIIGVTGSEHSTQKWGVGSIHR